MLKEELYKHKTGISELCKAEKIKKSILFELTVRNERTKSSNIDFLIEFSRKKSL